MAHSELVTLATAAEHLGVRSEQVRRYVCRGLLPAKKMGNVWVTPVEHVRSLQICAPRAGRPLTPAAAWRSIAAGDVDVSDPWRHINRGRISRWFGTAAMIADLLRRPDVVVGGAHAACVHDPLLDPLPEEAHVYLCSEPISQTERDQRGPLDWFVASGLGNLVVYEVDTPSWKLLLSISGSAEDHEMLEYGTERTMYAPPAVAALDLAASPHPREQDVAEIMAGRRG